MKKSCEECPWVNANPHSIKWRRYSEKMVGENPHGCHMKTKDVWGKKSDIKDEFKCTGKYKK